MEYETAVVVRTIILIQAFLLFIAFNHKLVYEKTSCNHVGHVFLLCFSDSFIRFADFKFKDIRTTKTNIFQCLPTPGNVTIVATKRIIMRLKPMRLRTFHSAVTLPTPWITSSTAQQRLTAAPS